MIPTQPGTYWARLDPSRPNCRDQICVTDGVTFQFPMVGAEIKREEIERTFPAAAFSQKLTPPPFQGGAYEEPVHTFFLRNAPEGIAGATALQITPIRVMSAVSAHLGVPVNEIIAPDRRAHVVTARQISMYLMRNLAALTFERIALAMGRDHSTVMHGVEATRLAMQTDAHTAGLIADLTLLLTTPHAAEPTSESENPGGELGGDSHHLPEAGEDAA